jgi:hypothetical protein
MSRDNHIHFVHYNGETEQECVQILKICLQCGCMKVSVTCMRQKAIESILKVNK